MENVVLYTFFDDEFFEYGYTMIYSFIKTNPWFKGDIIILCDNGENCCLSDKNFEKVRKFYNRTILKKIDIETYNKIFANFPSLSRKSFKASFYKLEMLRKDNYAYKLYIDADTCFNASVEELFNGSIADGSYGLMARDCVSSNYTSEEITEKTDADYGNMGFLLINGNMLEDNDYEKVIEKCSTIKSGDYLNKHTFRGVYPDQDCLNEFLTNIKLVPALIYDAPAHHLNIDTMEKAKILHYYGIKPWSEYGAYKSFYIWYKWYFFAMKKLKELGGR